MLNVNDDMDELLRRAAENYPLKTDDANFDKVLEELKAGKNAEVVSKKSGGRGRVLWLLLLLPLSFVCNRYVYPGTDAEPTTQNIKKPVENSSVVQGNNNSNDKESKPAKQEEVSDKRLAATTSLGKQDDELVAQNNAPTNRSLNSGNSNKKIAAQNETPERTSKASKRTNNDHPLLNRNSPIENASASSKQPSTGMYNKEGKTSIDKTERTGGDKLSADQVTGNLITPGVAEETKLLVDNDAAPASNDYKNDTVENNLNLSKTSKDSSTSPTVTATIKTTDKIVSKHFYAGLVLGPDLSAVKSTNVSKIGISVGVLAGYQFNRKFSVETGLLWDKKFYNSEGQYFDSKKLNLPSYVMIIGLDGYCNMFELPLGVKYNFVQNIKSNWFAVAGVSSYFMKKESYDYSYLSYGQLHSRTVDYKNSGTNWLSMLNLSIGYTHKLGKSGLLRLEPYIKIPVRRVGIGSLPISSTGLCASFVKEIF
jgi:hypothetical protein